MVGSSVCGSSPAQTFAITVNPVAAQPGAISGSGTVCQSQNSIAYSVTNSAGITYTWNYSGNGFSIATGTGTNSITANYSAAATSGTLSVTGSNSCGSGTAQTLAITVTPIPTAPTAAINTATSTEIDWNWYSVSGATGYKWNTTNNYAGATNNGTSTTHAQTTGLICGLNTLYVWAYNSCGNSSPVILTQTIGDIPCSGAGTIGTIAGDGSNSDLGDGGPAACSEVNMVYGIAADASGNAYVAEYSGSRIRKITASTGIITTIAGNGTLGFSGDGGQATAAAIHGANGVAVDASGNVYIADYGNHRIRKVTVSTGIITTIAGGGIGGDGGPATAATLGNIYGVGIDGSGNVYIADYSSAVIRKVTVSSGIISTIAGTGVQGYNSDGIAATAAKLYYPTGVAVDGSGNVYISDSYNARIRKVTGGIISTYTGNGTGGYSGDGGQATAAQILSPYGVALDASGNVYIADFNNDLIRKVTTSTGIITSIAGNYSNGFSGDGGPATNAQIVQPTGVAVDATGNVYIADYGNARIRKVCK